MAARLYVANTTAVVHADGKRHRIRKDITTVREGHPIMQGRERLFRPLDIDYDTEQASAAPQVEQATAAPGERRELTSPDTAAVRAWAREAGIEVPDRGRIPASVIEQYQAAQEA